MASEPKNIQEQGFRSSLFGFDKNDVLAYMNTLVNEAQQQELEYQQKLQALQARIDALGSEHSGADAQTASLQERLTAAEQRAEAAEAKQRWGSTDAYRESQTKTAGKSEEQLRQDGSELMAFFARLGGLKSGDPNGDGAQSVVAELQRFITEHYYNCTKQILSGLGQMYVADERFKANIDNAGGEGTAEFAAKAIEFYCAH